MEDTMPWAIWCAVSILFCSSHHIMQLEISFPGPCALKPCFPQLPTAARANVQKTLEFLAFLHDPPKGRPYNYRQNLIISPKPFKNLGKMNVFIIRSCADPVPV